MPYTRSITHTRPNTSIEWYKPTPTANVYASNGFIEFKISTSPDELTKVFHTTWDTQINGLTFIASLNSNTSSPDSIHQTLDFLINTPGYIILGADTIDPISNT